MPKKLKVTPMVIALAMAATVAATSQAVTPPPQMGLASVTGSATAGGSIAYRFDVSVPGTGPLLVTGRVRGKNLSLPFAKFTATLPAGVTTVTGPYVMIPTNFTGTAVLNVTAFFKGRAIGTRYVVFTVAPAPVPASSVSTNLYGVGFESAVVLNGAIVSTLGMGGTPTYAWTQLNGPAGAKAPAVLSANNVATPTLTTASLTNFVMMTATTNVRTVADIQGGVTNQIYVTPEHRFGAFSGLSLDVQTINESTYVYQVLVSGNSITRTGKFTVACANQTPAHPNIPVGAIMSYRGATNSTSWSLVAAPAGSTAALQNTNSLTPQLRTDVEGVYIIKDNVTGKTITNTAASYTGYEFCAICHGPGNNVGQPDLVTPWSQTAHASMFARSIVDTNGHYSESCLKCHTVGYDKTPSANNGGFDDVQAATGWKFPSTINSSNWNNVPTALKKVANIQCENCHGPGSRHPGSPSLTLESRVCAHCHQDGNHHVRPQQWELSPHGNGFENISNSRGTNPLCSRCHSAVGYTDVAKGKANLSTTNSVTIGAGPMTCQACHDPHDTFDNEDRKQLRVYGNALFGNPYYRTNNVYVGVGESLLSTDPRIATSNVIITNAGPSATCLTCHNGRQLPTQVQLYGANTNKFFYQTGGPHDQLAGEMFTGVGAIDYGQVMGNSFHTYLADCQSCHMYQLRAPTVSGGVTNILDSVTVAGVETPVTAAVYAKYVNVLGDHTFGVTYMDGTNEVQDVAACNQCHTGAEKVTEFDFKSVFTKDYDGNGLVEGVQTEVRSLMRSLATVIVWGSNAPPANGTAVTNAVYASTNATTGIWMPLRIARTIASGKTNYVTTVDNTIGSYVTGFGTAVDYYGLGNTNNVKLVEAQRKAVWNWLVQYREGSWGVHNTQYSVRLLQTTYTDLSTNFNNDVSKTFQNAFPKAFLR